MNEWSSFFSTIAETSATLTGLIFVGVSISLSRVLSIPAMPARAFGALILLAGVLLASVFALIPFQRVPAFGAELLILGIVLWGITFAVDRAIIKKVDTLYKKTARLSLVMTQVAILPYIVSGIVIMFTDLSGIYWLVPGIMISFIKAVLDAWVLLIEIHR